MAAQTQLIFTHDCPNPTSFCPWLPKPNQLFAHGCPNPTNFCPWLPKPNQCCPSEPKPNQFLPIGAQPRRSCAPKCLRSTSKYAQFLQRHARSGAAAAGGRDAGSPWRRTSIAGGTERPHDKPRPVLGTAHAHVVPCHPPLRIPTRPAKFGMVQLSFPRHGTTDLRARLAQQRLAHRHHVALC